MKSLLCDEEIVKLIVMSYSNNTFISLLSHSFRKKTEAALWCRSKQQNHHPGAKLDGDMSCLHHQCFHSLFDAQCKIAYDHLWPMIPLGLCPFAILNAQSCLTLWIVKSREHIEYIIAKQVTHPQGRNTGHGSLDTVQLSRRRHIKCQGREKICLLAMAPKTLQLDFAMELFFIVVLTDELITMASVVKDLSFDKIKAWFLKKSLRWYQPSPSKSIIQTSNSSQCSAK